MARAGGEKRASGLAFHAEHRVQPLQAVVLSIEVRIEISLDDVLPWSRGMTSEESLFRSPSLGRLVDRFVARCALARAQEVGEVCAQAAVVSGL